MRAAVADLVEAEKKRAESGMKEIIAKGGKLRHGDLQAMKTKALIQLLIALGVPEEDVKWLTDKKEAIALAIENQLVYRDEWE